METFLGFVLIGGLLFVATILKGRREYRRALKQAQGRKLNPWS